MALPKKRTSKSRTKRRFSAYANNQRENLLRKVDSLTHIGRPFIYDKDAVGEDIKGKATEATDTKSPKLKIEKVDKIEVTETATKTVKAPKTAKKIETESKDEPSTDKTEQLKDEKGHWFKDLFSNKKSDSGFKDMKDKSQKKVFRRKSI